MRRSFYGSRRFAVGAAALGLALGALVAPTNVQAQSSILNFNGNADLADAPGSGGSLLFVNFLGAGNGSVSAIEAITGEFAGNISTGDVGSIADLTISSVNVQGLPISSFMTFGPYTFDLTGTYPAMPAGAYNFGPLALYASGGGTSANFGVKGTVTGGSWTTPQLFSGIFTAQFTGMTPAQVYNQVNSGNTLPVSFSGNLVVTTTPEPSTYLLMGTGLLALVLVARRRSSMQA